MPHAVSPSMMAAAGVLAIIAGGATPARAQGMQTFLYSFPAVPKMATGTLGEPSGPLSYVSGSFYGEAAIGGTGQHSGLGGIYKISATGSVSTLYQFTSPANGDDPVGGLTYYNGVFYGVTQGDGTQNGGTVFALTPAGGQTTLHVFAKSGTTDGREPSAPLVVIGGMLYGTTVSGGANNIGTLYAINASGQETLLHSFAGTDGTEPDGGLMAIGGTLYGTTFAGGTGDRDCNLTGSTGCGTLFAADLTGAITTLHNFANTGDGAEPNFGLLNLGGTLYGVTATGGAHGCGTIFSDVPAAGFTTLHAFKGGTADACTPNGGLAAIGTTLYGPALQPGVGAIYALQPTGHISLDFQFDTTDGQTPDATLLFEGGKLWGVTELGGSGNAGTVFALAPFALAP